MKGFIRSKFFRIGSIFVACLLLCISFVPLFFKPVEEAKADNVQTYFIFEGSDLFIPFSRNYYAYNADEEIHFIANPVPAEIYFMNLSCSLMTYPTVVVGGYNSTSFRSIYVPDCPAPVYTAYECYGADSDPLFTNFFQNSIGGIVSGDIFASGVLAVSAYNVNSSGQNVNITSVSDVNSKTIFKYTQYFGLSDSLDLFGYIGPHVDTYVQYGFSSDVVSVRLYGNAVYPGSYGSRNIEYVNHIVYTDSKGFICDIVFTSFVSYSQNYETDPSDSYLSSLIFDDRTYYLIVDGGFEEGRLVGIAEGEQNKLEYANAQVEAARVEWNKDLDILLDKAEQKGFSEGEAYGFQQGVGSSFGLEPFLSSAFSALDVPIFGVFSLGQLFALIVGVSLVFIVLKIFAGG